MIEHITVSFQLNQMIFIAFLAGLDLGLLAGTAAVVLCAVKDNPSEENE
ncbi:MAG: hypothetical protein JXA14_26220 [Anaerolineae bacterium]|nr:hypothetical protein [Anaerolineae bacterium]